MAIQGFSLIELLIVLLITSILGSFVYLGYQQHMIRVYRIDGKTALYHLANRLERYYSKHNTYETATLEDLQTAVSSGGKYTLSLIDVTASTYQLQATPQGEQARLDTECQSFILTHDGAQRIGLGPGGIPTGSSAQCW